MSFWPSDWSMIFVPEAPLAELVVRGSVIYWFLFALMRLSGRRLLAKLAMSDMLVMLLIAVAVREGITGNYHTLGDAMVSGATILGWDLVVDRVAFHVEPLRKLLRHSPLPIIRDGVLLVEHARDQLLTRQEIMQQLRDAGVESVAEVKEATLEQDGSFSVLRR